MQKFIALQESILGPLLFLIYINDLSDGLWSNVNFFADDAFLFPVMYNTSTSTNERNNDLKEKYD